MNVNTLSVGELGTNCYIIYDDTAAVVIDPGAEAERIIAALGGRELSAILLTHGHFDHIGAAAELKSATAAPVYMHEADEEMIDDPQKSLAFMTGTVPAPFKPDFYVSDGDILSFGDLSFRVLHTPGHSGGGASYVIENSIFSGDLIFKCSVGRFDYGSFTDEMASVKRVLSEFPDSFVIYPGHGPSTTVGYEKKYNPYVGGGR